MRCNLTRAQRVREFRIPDAQVIDPDRGIDQDHVTASFDRGPPPVNISQLPLAAAQKRKAASALALDQRVERFPQQDTSLGEATQSLRAFQQGIVQIDGSAHVGYSLIELILQSRAKYRVRINNSTV